MDCGNNFYNAVGQRIDWPQIYFASICLTTDENVLSGSVKYI